MWLTSETTGDGTARREEFGIRSPESGGVNVSGVLSDRGGDVASLNKTVSIAFQHDEREMGCRLDSSSLGGLGG